MKEKKDFDGTGSIDRDVGTDILVSAEDLNTQTVQTETVSETAKRQQFGKHSGK